MVKSNAELERRIVAAISTGCRKRSDIAHRTGIENGKMLDGLLQRLRATQQITYNKDTRRWAVNNSERNSPNSNTPSPGASSACHVKPRNHQKAA